MTEPALGAFGVTATNGWKAWVIRAVTRSTVNHAFVAVGNGRIIEANPFGADLGWVGEYPHAIWSDAPPDGKGPAVAAAAIRLKGTPYSWIDDACIGLADVFGWHVPEPVRKRLTRRTRLMCSQLVDTAYRDAGLELFHDGRIAGDVSPGDLLDVILAEKKVGHGAA